MIALPSGGCEGPTGPGGETQEPTDGWIQVETATTGALLDADGYVVKLDGGEEITLGRNATMTLPEPIARGEHVLELTGVAQNCGVLSTNPLQLTVVAGDTASAVFLTSCVDPRAFEIAVATEGSSFDADAFGIRVDGAAERLIDLNETMTWFLPDWSPGGAYEVELTGLASNCALTGANPRTVTALSSGPTPVGFEISCEYVPGEIAYTSDRSPNADVELYTMDAHGNAVVRVTVSGGADPAWSPDGMKIAFARERDVTNWDSWFPETDVYVMNADGTGMTRLTDDSGPGGAMPAWSPDGSRIAYAGDADIWLMNADGSNPVRLTNQGLSDWSPAWSPQGTHIAFTRSEGGSTDLYVMRDDGTDLVNLTNDAARDDQVAWSPDGTMIAFTTNRTGNNEIFVMNADGSNPVNMTEHPAHDGDPVWSPDGTRIAFTTNRDGNPEIYVVDADGSNLMNLTRHPAADERPAWVR